MNNYYNEMPQQSLQRVDKKKTENNNNQFLMLKKKKTTVSMSVSLIFLALNQFSN